MLFDAGLWRFYMHWGAWGVGFGSLVFRSWPARSCRFLAVSLHNARWDERCTPYR